MRLGLAHHLRLRAARRKKCRRVRARARPRRGVRVPGGRRGPRAPRWRGRAARARGRPPRPPAGGRAPRRHGGRGLRQAPRAPRAPRRAAGRRAEGGFTARGRRRRPRGDDQLRAVRQHNQSGARVRRRAPHESHRGGAPRPYQNVATGIGKQDRRPRVRVEARGRRRGLAARGNARDQCDRLLDARERPRPRHVHACVEINQCVGCTRQFFTKSFLGDDAAVLARSSGEEPASPRHRAGVASMASRTTR